MKVRESGQSAVESLVLDILARAPGSTFAFVCIEVGKRMKGDQYNPTYRALRSLRKRRLVRYGWDDSRWYPVRKREGSG